MAIVMVLANDWDGGVDPVPYYATDPGACLDFNSKLLKFRANLAEQGRLQMKDCANRVSYNVVKCGVTG